MSNQKVRQLVDQLMAEVKASELDEESMQKLRGFESAIDDYISTDSASLEDQSILDKAKSLEITFAQKHPTAEGIMRDIMNTLVGMGV